MAGLPLMQGAADRPLPALSNECGGGATLSDPHSQPWVLRQGKAQSLVPPLLKAFIAERLSLIPHCTSSLHACSEGSPLKSQRMALTGCAGVSIITAVVGG